MPVNSIIIKNNSDDKVTEKSILTKLKTVFDPEIPVNIYELGLIYEIHLSKTYDIKIVMTLTSPNCPEIESMPQEIKEKIESIDKIINCDIEIVFEPQWTMDFISEEAKLELGLI